MQYFWNWRKKTLISKKILDKKMSYEAFAMSCKFYYEGKDKLCRQESTKKHILSNDDSITKETQKATTKKKE